MYYIKRKLKKLPFLHKKLVIIFIAVAPDFLKNLVTNCLRKLLGFINDITGGVQML